MDLYLKLLLQLSRYGSAAKIPSPRKISSPSSDVAMISPDGGLPDGGNGGEEQDGREEQTVDLCVKSVVVSLLNMYGEDENQSILKEWHQMMVDLSIEEGEMR